MKIKSILNNSALIAMDHGEEKILVGKGISFSKHSGDSVDEAKIEKVFTGSDEDELASLLHQIPAEYFEAANVIIRYAEKKLSSFLDKNICITLPDHIEAAMERYRNNQQLTSTMIDDLRLLYPEVYKVSEWARDYLNAQFDANLNNDEIGFLAFHFLNAMKGEEDTKVARKVMKFVHTVTEVMQEKYADVFALEGLSWNRFLAHLKYLAVRYADGRQLNENIVLQLNLSKEKNDQIDQCLRDIENAIQEKFGGAFCKDEENYLRLHLARLLETK